jgi:5-methylcytosine-specific restriction endonuclease McrA
MPQAIHLGEKPCEVCHKAIQLKVRRDLIRKKFCSHACRQLSRWRSGGMAYFLNAIPLASTPEANAKKGRSGSSHPRWISDRTQCKRRPRYEMREWSRLVFARDNYTCRGCGQRGVRLQAHHILSYATFVAQRWDVINGLTLCVSCHKKTDSYGRKVTRGDHNSISIEGTTRLPRSTPGNSGRQDQGVGTVNGLFQTPKAQKAEEGSEAR